MRAAWNNATRRFELRASWSEVADACGALTNEDFRQGLMHLADVAAQNDDVDGLAYLSRALGIEDGPIQPWRPQRPVDVSLQRLLTEAMAAGKEMTLRKLARVIDPHGEYIDVPAEWIGKGPG